MASAPNTPPTSASPSTPPKSLPVERLLWHTLHLCSALLSQLGAWLSLEALHRDSVSTGLSLPISYYPLVTAQGTMMFDGCHNLDTAVRTLMAKPEYLDTIKNAGYESVLDAAKKLSATVEMLSGGINSKEDVEVMRRAYDEMIVLCYGDASNGIRGWKEAWNEIFGYNKQ